MARKKTNTEQKTDFAMVYRMENGNSMTAYHPVLGDIVIYGDSESYYASMRGDIVEFATIKGIPIPKKGGYLVGQDKDSYKFVCNLNIEKQRDFYLNLMGNTSDTSGLNAQKEGMLESCERMICKIQKAQQKIK